MARPDLARELHQQVQTSVNAGAKLHGTMANPDKAPWYPAGVLTHVNPLMPATTEELFGPVATVMKAESTGHAIALANDTAYGLGASIWTEDLDLAWSLEPELQVGALFINELVRSDFRVPFGGVKQSGYGKELGKAGMLEFCNVKSIWQS
jgi:succinate-semialdehyde dehydrogenase/glutarate-semialdehyde dehydrogenase